jgi:hypothetical protein
MTDTSTEAVERLLDGVTPGPWRWHNDAGDWYLAPGVWVAWGTDGTPGGDVIDRANSRFIASSRDLVPALLAERDAALARASEAENKASSAQHSVAVLEKRAAGFLARAERAEAALREIAAIPRSDAAYAIIQVMARHALKGCTDE